MPGSGGEHEGHHGGRRPNRPATGFIGLGNMGAVLAENLLRAGHPLVTHDLAGPGRNPDGAEFVSSPAEVAGRAAVIVLSLPDGPAVLDVAARLAGSESRTASHVVDTSTVGLHAARSAERILADAGIGYVDAPVSGGVAGARARTLAVMYAGRDEACESVRAVLEGLSDRRFRVGRSPGMAQALKLANNYLSAAALAATSEAVAFGVSVGLEMDVMLEVLNASSGRSAATSDKFVRQVATGAYAAGFTNTLMAKDLKLYLDAVGSQGSAATIGEVTARIWDTFAACEPGADFTRIYPFTRDDRAPGG